MTMTGWTLITGASEGLGVEFARIAAREGRNLILTARSEDKLNALAAELSDVAGDILVLPADLNDLTQAEELWQKASNDRRIDILVNNAGLGSNGDFADGENWTREMTSGQCQSDGSEPADEKGNPAYAGAGRRQDHERGLGRRFHARPQHGGLPRHQGLCAVAFRGRGGRNCAAAMLQSPRFAPALRRRRFSTPPTCTASAF